VCSCSWKHPSAALITLCSSVGWSSQKTAHNQKFLPCACENCFFQSKQEDAPVYRATCSWRPTGIFPSLSTPLHLSRLPVSDMQKTSVSTWSMRPTRTSLFNHSHMMRYSDKRKRWCWKSASKSCATERSIRTNQS
jgi:hypothetical protein